MREKVEKKKQVVRETTNDEKGQRKYKREVEKKVRAIFSYFARIA